MYDSSEARATTYEGRYRNAVAQQSTIAGLGKQVQNLEKECYTLREAMSKLITENKTLREDNTKLDDNLLQIHEDREREKLTIHNLIQARDTEYEDLEKEKLEFEDCYHSLIENLEAAGGDTAATFNAVSLNSSAPTASATPHSPNSVP